MATAYPPTLQPRSKDEQAFVNRLVALEAVRLSAASPVVRTFAHCCVSLAAFATGAMKTVNVGITELSRASIHQAVPEVSEAFVANAIDSAFQRAIERDAKHYAAYRAEIHVNGDATDPAPNEDESDLFPALTQFRNAMGV